MDVLIKNMEFPKERIEITIYSDGCWVCSTDNEKHGKVVEVKPHGRLIDADRLRQVMENAMANDSDKPLYKMMYSYVIRVLAESPTVLEASNGKVSD